MNSHWMKLSLCASKTSLGRAGKPLIEPLSKLKEKNSEWAHAAAVETWMA
jgi:hypothetical protein